MAQCNWVSLICYLIDVNPKEALSHVLARRGIFSWRRGGQLQAQGSVAWSTTTSLQYSLLRDNSTWWWSVESTYLGPSKAVLTCYRHAGRCRFCPDDLVGGSGRHLYRKANLHNPISPTPLLVDDVVQQAIAEHWLFLSKMINPSWISRRDTTGHDFLALLSSITM